MVISRREFMKLQPMSRKEEVEMTTEFINDLNLVFGQLKQDIINRVKSSSSPQEALGAISILDEKFEE